MEIHMIYLIESYSGWWFGHILYFSIGNFIIPTAELTPSFFRGVGRLKPPTRYEITPNHHEITIKPPLNHHFPMVFLWFHHWTTVKPPWASQGSVPWSSRCRNRSHRLKGGGPRKTMRTVWIYRRLYDIYIYILYSMHIYIYIHMLIN